MLNLLDLNLEQVLLLILADLVFKDEEVEHNLEDMWLQERDDHQNSALVVKYSDHLVEVSIAFLDGLFLVIDCDGIKSTFIDGEIE